jgi:iron(III) transport system permease protein
VSNSSSTGVSGKDTPVFRRFLRFPDTWQLVTAAIALLVLVPILILMASLFTPDREIWAHLAEHLLATLLLNTFLLVSGVSIVTLLLGVPLGWLTGICEFPGRRFFSWALLLPMALPSYVLAVVYLGILDFSGPVEKVLQFILPQTGVIIGDIRTTPGIIAIISLSLYPYVYLLARTGFMTQGTQTMEAARTLGCDQRQAFFRVALPMSRPWIAGGLMLVIMETLADFGAVAAFNYDTFTTGIYKAWYGLFSISAAAQLSSILLVFVIAVLLMEQRMRFRMRFIGINKEKQKRINLTGARKTGAVFLCMTVLTVAFLVPVLQLLFWTSEIFEIEFGVRYLDYTCRTLALALIAAVLTCMAALILSYTRRLHSDSLTGAMVKLATVGYGMPGSVLAVGFFVMVSHIDKSLVTVAETFFHVSIDPVFRNTIIIMLAGYLVRFMAPAYAALDSNMQRITPGLDDVARLAGLRGFTLLRRVHIPMLSQGILVGTVLVFVDVMKELPLTLMTRPFGWNTLAVKIFELTSEGEWERAALPSLVLVLAGLIPVFLLIRSSSKT